MADKTTEILQAVLSANDERRDQALRVLRGEVPEATKPVVGPLLLGMGAAAKYLGVSRATLWRFLQTGKIRKVELFPGSFRVRREDLIALSEGAFGCSGVKSRRGRPRKDSRARDPRFVQLKALADEGDENAASDLFREFEFDHGAGRFVKSGDGAGASA